MNKFFKPEDFNSINYDNSFNNRFADAANAKLELESMFAFIDEDGVITSGSAVMCGKSIRSPKYKALLINIERIEECKHPEDKVAPYEWRKIVLDYPSGVTNKSIEFRCQCGAVVTPKTFEVVPA